MTTAESFLNVIYLWILIFTPVTIGKTSITLCHG
jgi:hypothetical protein